MLDYMSDPFDCMSVSTDIRPEEILETVFHFLAKIWSWMHTYLLSIIETYQL
jgi:hypothetical protein